MIEESQYLNTTQEKCLSAVEVAGLAALGKRSDRQTQCEELKTMAEMLIAQANDIRTDLHEAVCRLGGKLLEPGRDDSEKPEPVAAGYVAEMDDRLGKIARLHESIRASLNRLNELV